MRDHRPPGEDMSPADFRHHGRELIDWIADYWERVESLPVLAQVEPGALRAALPAAAPELGEPFDDVLADLEAKILPALTHWQSPRFFAYFPANSSAPSVLGELLSAGLGVQGMMWLTSPACTELEMRVLDWLVGALALPEAYLFERGGGGVIQDSASSSNLCAILAARERATGGESNRTGCDGSLVAYVSSETHSSVEKGVKIAGIGASNLRLVEIDEARAMRADRLAERIREDREAGLVPFFVCATLGTTATGAMDPLARIGPVCREAGVWLHVDAAMAGSAALCPELRGMHEGIEHADSYCFDPHKWLFVNFDCSCFWVRERSALTEALTVSPEYLRAGRAASQVTDYRDWHVPLGRRFRALKLWMVLRHYGLAGLRRKLRAHLEMAQELAARVDADGRFEVVAPMTLNLVCFRLRGSDENNERLLEAINRSGVAFLSSSRVGGRLVLRACVGQTYTERRHVDDLWSCIQREADRVGGG